MDDRGGYPALRALVVMEWRRVLPVALRTVGMGAAVVGVLAATGALTVGRLAFLLALIGGVPVMGFPTNALKDKLDGGLEFLRLLPVSAVTQVTGRLLALLGVAFPGALVATVAAVLALQEGVPGALEPRAVIQMFGAVLLFTVGGGFFATAMVLRFELQKSNYVIFGFVGAVWVLDRVLPDPVGTFLALSVHTWFVPAAWTLGVVSVVAMAWAAFALACSGIERFTPSGDRLTW